MKYRYIANLLPGSAFLLIAALSTLAPPASSAQSRKQRRAMAQQEAAIEANLRQHIALLASDSLEGRRTGTPGEAKAVAYLENYYKTLGIAAPQGWSSYRQPFTIDQGKFATKNTHLIIDDQPLAWEKDYFAFGWAAPGTLKRATAVALQESGEPWWLDLEEVLTKEKDNPHFALASWIATQAKTAQAKGATALLVYNSSKLPDNLKYQATDREQTVNIPVVYLTPAAAQRLKLAADSHPYIDLQLAFEPKTRTGTNVVAYLHRNAPRTIILGAHLDHLGYGEDENSRHTGEPAIHNGADDNASGTAALMELARLLQQQTSLPYNVLIAHFSGEELGLYGSKYLAANLPPNLPSPVFMMNMDMVGRLNDSSRALTIGGIGTSPAWPAIIEAAQPREFTLKYDSSGTGPSDHTSFYRLNMPVLFFFTGLHTDYHKPSDDAALINYKGTRQIVEYMQRIIQASAQQPQISFTKTKEQSMGTGRFKVSMGIMPDYTFTGTGVRADGVVDGRAAQKAGLQAGDVVIQLGDHLITGVDTYMDALNRFDKGQTTTVTIRRGQQLHQFTITF